MAGGGRGRVPPGELGYLEDLPLKINLPWLVRVAKLSQNQRHPIRRWMRSLSPGRQTGRRAEVMTGKADGQTRQCLILLPSIPSLPGRPTPSASGAIGRVGIYAPRFSRYKKRPMVISHRSFGLSGCRGYILPVNAMPTRYTRQRKRMPDIMMPPPTRGARTSRRAEDMRPQTSPQ